MAILPGLRGQDRPVAAVYAGNVSGQFYVPASLAMVLSARVTDADVRSEGQGIDPLSTDSIRQLKTRWK